MREIAFKILEKKMEEGNKYQKAIKNYDCRERPKDLNRF